MFRSLQQYVPEVLLQHHKLKMVKQNWHEEEVEDSISICSTCRGAGNNIVLDRLSWNKVRTKVGWRKICDGRQTWWRWRQRLDWGFHSLLLTLVLALMRKEAYLLTLLLALLRLEDCEGIVRTTDAGDKEGLETDGAAELDKIGQEQRAVLYIKRYKWWNKRLLKSKLFSHLNVSTVS